LALLVQAVELGGPLSKGGDNLLRQQAVKAFQEAEVLEKAKKFKEAKALLDRGLGLLPPSVKGEIRYQAKYKRALFWGRLDQPVRALRELEALDLVTRRQGFPFAQAVRARAALLTTAWGQDGEACQVLRSWLKAFPKAKGGRTVRLGKLLKKLDTGAGGGGGKSGKGRES